MFWQSFAGIINYNFTTNATTLTFQLSQGGATGSFLQGTTINSTTLSTPLQYNLNIVDGEYPGLMPYLMASNIEYSQQAPFFIDFGANVSTTFAFNCTQSLAGS